MNKPRGRPFEQGNSFGRGRPKGSRNKEKSPGQRIFEQYAEPLVRKCIAQALQGDRSAMRLCMERISPAQREASIRMSLPKIETAKDVHRAAEKVTEAIRRGEITPTDGETIMRILESRSRVIERVDFESRLERLEREPERPDEGV